ncbi:MAG: hypothetical protein ACXWLM_01995 [Myxococcales bacterium]
MEPLGAYEQSLAPPLALAIGACAVLTATALLELSRTLAEKYRGRWFAGNGRDVFHVAAAGVIASALLLNGLPPALACLAATSLLMLPLLFLDSLPARRHPRIALLLGLVGLAAAPPLLEPQSIVDTANLLARFLFRH